MTDAASPAQRYRSLMSSGGYETTKPDLLMRVQ